jgi:hypothetical protein
VRSSPSSSSSSINDTDDEAEEEAAEVGASAMGNMKSVPGMLVGDCLPGDV